MKSSYTAPFISIEDLEPMTLLQASLKDITSIDTNLDGTTGSEGEGGLTLGGGGDGSTEATTPRAGRSYLWDE